MLSKFFIRPGIYPTAGKTAKKSGKFSLSQVKLIYSQRSPESANLRLWDCAGYIGQIRNSKKSLANSR